MVNASPRGDAAANGGAGLELIDAGVGAFTELLAAARRVQGRGELTGQAAHDFGAALREAIRGMRQLEQLAAGLRLPTNASDLANQVKALHRLVAEAEALKIFIAKNGA
jgi:hypothetical protein